MPGGPMRLRGTAVGAYGGAAECRLSWCPVDPLMCAFVRVEDAWRWGRDSMDLMEHTVVRCAEGHVFATGSLPMQRLGAGRIGPGRLVRCPRCARLRSVVRVREAVKR
jgi:hypothetical protein